jgi:hypothetical protein
MFGDGVPKTRLVLPEIRSSPERVEKDDLCVARVVSPVFKELRSWLIWGRRRNVEDGRS